MTTVGVVLVTIFLASCVEAIEMVTIVVGVGATSGWRSALTGAAVGFVPLALIVGVLGVALTAIPISPLRVLVGTLLLLFGLQWYRKGIVRVAQRGLAGIGEQERSEAAKRQPGIDWTAFFVSFKGVFLEGLEIAIIVVSFGASAGQLWPSVASGVAAIVVIGAIGFALHGPLTRIPRSVLQLIVGTLLTTFGTFWALEGLGVNWPQGDGDILALFIVYGLAAAAYIGLERRTHRPALEVA
jgi:uncharacterized membrane protein